MTDYAALYWLGVGDAVGATAFGALPASVASALNIAIYGMFVAILVPPMRRLRPVLFTVCVSAGISCIFRFVPALSGFSSGWVIIFCAVAASAWAAVRYPVGEEDA